MREAAIRLHPADNVVIAKASLQANTRLTSEGSDLIVKQTIPSGHKIAVASVAPGEAVRRYGQIIGFATRPIEPGDHVHSHNLSVSDFARDYAFGVDVKPIHLAPAADRRTFMGFRRANGRVGTRNYVALISTVNCSAHVTRAIAQHFTPDRLARYPNVDGVIALTHACGCSAQVGSVEHRQLQRVLAGMALHPNVGAYVLIGLGCEVNQIGGLADVILRLAETKNLRQPAEIPHHDAVRNDATSEMPTLVIQDLGLATVERTLCAREGIAARDLHAGLRNRRVVQARRLFCHIAVRGMGYSEAAVARFLGITTSGVNRVERLRSCPKRRSISTHFRTYVP